MKYLTSDFLREDYLAHYASPYYDPQKAHEYYMKNRELKGRRSTTGLNEKGRIAAQYAKSQINAERDNKLKVRGETYKTDRENRKSSYTNDRQNALAKKTSDISSLTEKLKSDKETENRQKTESIKQTTSAIQSEISRLSSQLSNMNAASKRANKATFQKQIAALRQQNSDVKAKINEAYKQAVTQLSENTASEKSNVQNEYKTTSNSLRKSYSEDTKAMRDSYTADKKAIREEANSKYETELNNLKSQSEFKKTKKGKKGRKSSSKVKVKSGPGTQDFLNRYKAKKSK